MCLEFRSLLLEASGLEFEVFVLRDCVGRVSQYLPVLLELDFPFSRFFFVCFLLAHLISLSSAYLTVVLCVCRLVR